MPRIGSEQKNDANTHKHISFIKTLGLVKEAQVQILQNQSKIIYNYIINTYLKEGKISKMNVDIDNFHDVRKFIQQQQLIRKSKFIAFDLQFTGLQFQNHEKDKYDMFLNEKYAKMAAVANKFNILQVGLTFFIENQQAITKQSQRKRQPILLSREMSIEQTEKIEQKTNSEQKNGKYVAYPYNFYVFPRETPVTNPVVCMEAGSIQFNSKNNMDWNRWIRKGITYIRINDFNKHNQTIYTANINSVNTITNSNCNNILNPKSISTVLQEMTMQLRQIVEKIIDDFKDKESGFKLSYEVPKFGISPIRRAIQIYANQYQKNFLMSKISFPEEQLMEEDELLKAQQYVTLQIQIISEEQKKQYEELKKQQIFGFSLIFEEIWNSNKVLVGHHCLFDLLFLYSSFVDELPRDYQNFKKIIADFSDMDQKGRKIYDTKYLATKFDMNKKAFKRGTSLEELYRYFKKKQNQELMDQNKENLVVLPKNFQYDLDQPNLHEAGFDSYLTGWVFLHLPNEISDMGKISIHKSYFYVNLHTPGDFIRKDMKVFVVAIVLNNAFVPYDELRTMRSTVSKAIRDELQKDKLMNDIIVIDGFKQIFLSMKDLGRTQELVKFLIRMRKLKVVRNDNVMSLESWVKMRAEVSNQINTNSLGNKSKA